MGFLSIISSRMEEIGNDSMDGSHQLLDKGIHHMRDQSIGKKGFFTLSALKEWLNNVINTLNPPLRKLELVPIRVRVSDKKY